MSDETEGQSSVFEGFDPTDAGIATVEDLERAIEEAGLSVLTTARRFAADLQALGMAVVKRPERFRVDSGNSWTEVVDTMPSTDGGLGAACVFYVSEFLPKGKALSLAQQVADHLNEERA